MTSKMPKYVVYHIKEVADVSLWAAGLIQVGYIRLKNISGLTLAFIFGNFDTENTVVGPPSGILLPDQEINITVKYTPNNPRIPSETVVDIWVAPADDQHKDASDISQHFQKVNDIQCRRFVFTFCPEIAKDLLKRKKETQASAQCKSSIEDFEQKDQEKYVPEAHSHISNKSRRNTLKSSGRCTRTVSHKTQTYLARNKSPKPTTRKSLFADEDEPALASHDDGPTGQYTCSANVTSGPPEDWLGTWSHVSSSLASVCPDLDRKYSGPLSCTQEDEVQEDQVQEDEVQEDEDQVPPQTTGHETCLGDHITTTEPRGIIARCCGLVGNFVQDTANYCKQHKSRTIYCTVATMLLATGGFFMIQLCHRNRQTLGVPSKEVLITKGKGQSEMFLDDTTLDDYLHWKVFQRDGWW